MCDQNIPDAPFSLHHTTERGFDTGWCDPCIQPIVQALNNAGMQTVASCCGHGHRPAAICLEDDREILIMTFNQARELDHEWPDIHGEPVKGKAAVWTDA